MEALYRRNIVVVGKDGTEETASLVNHLVGKANSDAKKSDDNRLQKQSLVQITTGDTSYTIKFIDVTCSSYYGTNSGFSLDGTISEMRKCFSNEMTSVNAILFAINKDQITHDFNEVLESLMKKFTDEMKEISAVVIMNCDLKSEADRKEVVEEFKRSVLTKDLAAFVQQRVYAVSFPNSNMEVANEDAEQITKMVRSFGEMRLCGNLLVEEYFWERFWERFCERCAIM